MNLQYRGATRPGRSRCTGTGLLVADCHARIGLWKKRSKEDTSCDAFVMEVVFGVVMPEDGLVA